MKGIIIYENDLRAINAVKLKNVSFCCKAIEGDITDTLEGRPVICESANCSKDDTYNFETGALIALMKMCGVEKVKKAAKETFFDVAENSVNEYEEKIHALEKENNYLKYIKSCRESAIKSLENTRDLLINKNNELIEENKTLKEKFDKKVSDLRDQIHENSRLIQMNGELRDSENALKKDNEAFRKTCEKLKEENERLKNTRLKKKLDAMYGYVDTDNVKPELPRTLDINGTVYRKSIQIKDFGEQINKLTVDSLIEQSRAFTRKCVDEWFYKPPTKREEMWAEIFAIHKKDDVIIKVKKEDVNTFLHEIEKRFPEITWVSSVKIFETKYTICDIYEALKTCDEICFRLSKETKLSYSSDEFIYAFKGFKHIDYLPPMRWDLFKKGRIVVGVKNNYELGEFRKEVERNTGIRGIPMCPTNLCLFYSFDKDNYKIILESVEKPNIAKINGHKVVYWEDVR